MHILMSGATGLVGGALRSALERRGDTVVALSRNPEKAKAPALGWDPAQGQISEDALREVDAVIHLAGEPIASGRWTAEHKQKVRKSRVLSTQLLSKAVAESPNKPKVFISASAIGFYGERGAEVVDEQSEPGKNFLAKVCIAWEAEAERARQAQVRVVHPRIGIVLARSGGALAKMLTPFRLGLGGRLGSGDQYMSWIALDDVVGLLIHALDNPNLVGPINLTAPNAVTNQEFTSALGQSLGRPTVLPVPTFALRAALGEMADELLLSSMRVKPSIAESSGYTFKHPDLKTCLDDILSAS